MTGLFFEGFPLARILRPSALNLRTRDDYVRSDLRLDAGPVLKQRRHHLVSR